MRRFVWWVAALMWLNHSAAFAQEIDPSLQKKLDAAIRTVQEWADDPVIVDAVKRHNDRQAKAEIAQKKWAAATGLESHIRAYTKNSAAQFLQAHRTPAVTEAFVSGADGHKVAFLAKPTNWSHRGKPKHDVPMSGRVWQGPLELDESTGFRQVQVGVPVRDQGKAIGSLVVGFATDRL